MRPFHSLVLRWAAVWCFLFLAGGCQGTSGGLSMSARCLSGGDWVEVTFRNHTREALPLMLLRPDVLEFEIDEVGGKEVRYGVAPESIFRPGADHSQIVVVPPLGTLTRRVQLKGPFLCVRAPGESGGDVPSSVMPAGAGIEAVGSYGKLKVMYRTTDIDLAHPSLMKFWRGLLGPVDGGKVLVTAAWR